MSTSSETLPLSAFRIPNQQTFLEAGSVEIIDQLLLPHVVKWETVDTIQGAFDAIKSMKVSLICSVPIPSHIYPADLLLYSPRSQDSRSTRNRFPSIPRYRFRAPHSPVRQSFSLVPNFLPRILLRTPLPLARSIKVPPLLPTDRRQSS